MGALEKALTILFDMDEQGTIPSVNMYITALRECTKRRALAQAKRVHGHLAKYGLESSKFLGEHVVSTLVACGSLEDGLKVFQKLPQRTAFSWTSLISGYTVSGQAKEALETYYRMQAEGVKPSTYTFVTLLKACGILANLEEGKRIHAEACRYNCDSNLFVGTCLVCMYAKCGSIVDAKDVFDVLPQRDVVSWNAMLLAYVQQGQPQKALRLYEQMLEEGVTPSDWTSVAALQACGMVAENEDNVIQCLQLGKALHADVWSKGYNLNSFIGNTLITMYGKCGSFMDARNVFDGLSGGDVVSWSALVSTCVHQAEAEIALELYEHMMKQGLSPNDRTVVSVLQACGMLAEREEDVLVDGNYTKPESLQKVRTLHANIWGKSYLSDLFVCSSLVNAYSKSGGLVEACNVFYGFSDRDVVSWNVLLTTHAQHGEAEKVLQLYGQMLDEGVSPDVRSCVSALQACGILAEQEGHVLVGVQAARVASLEKGKAVHAEAWIRGYTSDAFVSSTLISMYGKCGSIVDAENVLAVLAELQLVSCNAMLSAYVIEGHGDKALHLYNRMQEEGQTPDFCTLLSVLQACGMLALEEADADVGGQPTKVSALEKGRAMHAEAWRKGYNSDAYILNALVSMYGKCGSVADAWNVFDGLSQRNMISWNAMLGTYVQQGQAEISVHVYEQLLEEGMSPDDRTLVCALQACAVLAEKEGDAAEDDQLPGAKSLRMGKEIHALAWSKGYKLDVFLANTLISLYGKCRSIVDARNVFSDLSQRDLVSWNAMLLAYVGKGQAETARQLYGQMLEEGVSPDSWTFVTVLQACASSTEGEKNLGEPSKSVQQLDVLKAIHAYAWMQGCKTDVFVCNTLISMYGKVGGILDAQNVFNAMGCRDVASWNAMLSAFVEQGHGEEALQLYEQMVEDDVAVNEITIICVLRACSHTGGLDVCRQIHHNLVAKGAHFSPLLATVLIHAYGRCASMVDAQDVFNLLPQPKVVSWNALIAGYSRQGNFVESLQCYEQMQLVGTMPNGVTFLSLLSACSHAGLVEKGVEYFRSMINSHGMTPEIEHYATMVDLLGRAGYFARIEELLSTMPMQPDLGMWLCLLGACRKYAKVALAKKAFDSAVHLQKEHAAAYVLMSNIYVDAGLWDFATEVNELRQKAGAWKSPGQSWIEHDQEVHRFVVADCKSRQQEDLYDLLRQVSLELEGRVSDR